MIDGGAGNDWIGGGFGNDWVEGGLGQDRFIYASIAEVGAGGDIIAGFQQGSDRIDLSAIDANTGAADDQSFVFTGAYAGGAYVDPGEIYTYQRNGYTEVYLNTTGGDAAEAAFALLGTYNLTAADFVL